MKTTVIPVLQSKMILVKRKSLCLTHRFGEDERLRRHFRYIQDSDRFQAETRLAASPRGTSENMRNNSAVKTRILGSGREIAAMADRQDVRCNRPWARPK